MISLDTETTGLDLHHGVKPYLVTICDENNENTYWEWSVDPITRDVKPPLKDRRDIQRRIREADILVLQNPKFDVQALSTVGINHWPWGKTIDTLMAGHLLASNQPHDLTTMSMIYLGLNVEPLERELEKATKESRVIVKDLYPNWMLAKTGLPSMPSVKGKTWKYDAWLPRAVAIAEDYPKDHPWYTVCADYANMDSASTLALWKKQKELLKLKGLMAIYRERLRIIPVVAKMEAQGITVNRNRLEELETTFTEGEKTACNTMTRIADKKKFELEIPKGGSNNSLKNFVFDVLNLEPLKRSKKTGEPSLDKATIEHWEATLPDGVGRQFIEALKAKRKRATALSYMASYRRFWLPITDNWFRLHPSLNTTGTDTLRFSSQNPNEQNISKQEGFNLRYCFGPTPGREWWSLDYNNLELRIPAYEAGETEMIGLFEQPYKPPFFGSYHLLVFSVLHPDKYNHADPEGLLKAKKKYATTWYQWTKNGNFAVQYGAIEKSGTADRAYHVPGGQHKIQARFGKTKKINEKLIKQAQDQGYVETLPDKTVDDAHGYPLYCTRTRWGSIMPTIPLNYHVQGTAMWIASKSLVYCQEYLDTLNLKSRKGYYLIMQVHDESVFDFPKGKTPESNLPKIRKLQRLMAQAGDDVGVPTPVSVDYHPNNWGESISV